MSESQPVVKIIYYNGNDDVPTSIRLSVPPDQVTLSDFKSAINIKPSCEHKFFFKTIVEGVGIVKEKIMEDDVKLPFFKGNIICYIESLELDCLCDVGHSRRVFNHHSHPHSLSHSHLQSHSHLHSHSSHSSAHSHSHTHSHPPNYHHQDEYYSEDDDDDETSSRISSSTNGTSVSRPRLRRKKLRKRHMSNASSVSSVTDNSSCYFGAVIKTVILSADDKLHLGMSLAEGLSGAQNGIYVGSLIKDGAIAAEGTIQPFDMLLQVDEHVLSDMTIDEALEIIRESIQKPGPMKLVVAKNYESNQDNYFPNTRDEPIQPINLEAWTATGFDGKFKHIILVD